MIPLSAGPLSMLFDPANALLRYVRLGDREILRGIFGAVRNRNWDTVPPDVQHVHVDEGRDRFELTFEALCCDGDVDFAWRGEVIGSADGSLSYMFDGQAKAPFLRNRIGLCVLHPIRECAGRPCQVEHVDGTVTEGRFPDLISPHQPFTGMRGIAHEVVPGLRAVATFAGDVFEMEDQRNWTDASFKTYSTPLHLPFPVRLDTGSHVRQSVRLHLDGRVQRLGRGAVPADVHVRVDWWRRRPRPPFGFGMAGTLNEAAHAAFGALRPDHVRVDLSPASPGWRDRLLDASRIASRAGARVHAALFLSDAGEPELLAVRDQIRSGEVPIGMWLVFHAGEKATSRRWIDLAHRILGPDTPMAAGTNAYFAELNRNRPGAETPAFPCFSINPQVHAFDDRSLVETLEAQRSTVETARSFSPRPVVISPVTLMPRFNPNATDSGAGALPASDPRQSTTFGAAWTLGTLTRLATSPDVKSLTFFETAGPRGVMDNEGHPYPMWHVFASLAGWHHVADAVTDAPLRVAALALERPDGQRRVLLAGLDTDPVRVVMHDIDNRSTYQVLAEDGFGAPRAVPRDSGQVDLVVPPGTVALLEVTLEGDSQPHGAARPA